MRLTRVEAAIILGTVALAGGAIGLFTRSADAASDRETAEGNARKVLQAAEAWQAENRSGCPTLTLLERDGKLDSDEQTDDAWGGRFRVVCDADGTEVISAGRDGKLHTADDIVARSEGRS
jgi:hypothetical protein